MSGLAKKTTIRLAFALTLLLGAVAAPRAFGWSPQTVRKNVLGVGGGAASSRPACGSGTMALHLRRADFLRSIVGGAVGGGLILAPPAAAAVAQKIDPKESQKDPAAKLRARLDSLEREAKKIDKAATREAKKLDKAVTKETKKIKKEIKKADRTVTKEVKKVSKEVKKEAKKAERAVKKETKKAMAELDKGTRVVVQEAKKLGDTVNKGTVGGGGASPAAAGKESLSRQPASAIGIDVSKLKTCDDPRGKCL